MPITKHKIFKIQISDDGKFTISTSVEKTINDFLIESNIVYVNHSVTTLTEDVEEYDNIKTLCKYVLISIVYKDLDTTRMDIKTTSNKTKSVVHRQIESGEALDEPDILTEIDKEIINFDNKTKIKPPPPPGS
jgi:superfamily I DNA and RNA helicase